MSEPTTTPEPVAKLTDPPKPGTALTQALTTANIAGQVAKSAMESGSFGLTGWVKALGNATAMMVVVFFLFMIYRDFQSVQRADREYERQERQRDREDRSRDRDAANAEIRGLTNEIRADRESQRVLVETQRQMTAELRTLVQALRPMPKKDDPEDRP